MCCSDVGPIWWSLKLPVVNFSRYTYLRPSRAKCCVHEWTDWPHELLRDCSFNTFTVSNNSCSSRIWRYELCKCKRSPPKKEKKENWTSCRFILSIIPSLSFFLSLFFWHNWIKWLPIYKERQLKKRETDQVDIRSIRPSSSQWPQEQMWTVNCVSEEVPNTRV